ncbi:MAG: zinc ribbon domain-containing protein [Deltaproteobacteria bacterium]|uniref:Zinc ribbon domain-containing protein n=1 Tax=Candidatus Zymogenus saltonus TaxID=2844893 RepID=A0A9D8PNU4_9DELT|nr:zinc ribbon domain-containing protein [Candidatus Zymogenus saltonus]
MKVSWFPDYINGLHKPLISQEQFFKAYAILHGKKPTVTTKSRNNPDFPLRNFVRCPKCDQKLTAGWSTGRKGVKYPYYHCRTKGCSLNIRKEDFERKFLDYLTCFQPNEEVMNLFEEIVLDVWKTKQAEMIKTENRIERELKDLKERKNRIDDLVIDGVFDEGTYREKSDALRDEMLLKQVELDDSKIHFVDFEECLKYCKYVLSNLGSFWENADIDLRQRFQSLIFPEKLYYESKTFRTTKIPYIIKKLQDKSPEKLHLASPRGFEPLSPA